MTKLKMEVFLPDGSDAGEMDRLLNELEQSYGDKVEVIRYGDDHALFEEYGLTASPALVIDEMIRIIGFCPSKDTVVSALEDLGLNDTLQNC